MIGPALQTLAVLAAGFALFRLVRAAMPAQGWLQRVVALGFVGRALLGQALFWISWAELPLLAHLQRGNGFWFFGIDGAMYFGHAARASSAGLLAIAGLSPELPAPFYVQTLAVATWLFGAVPSTALLLHLFCYLAAVALLVRWSDDARGAQTAAGVAIVALSLSPGFVLWSLQPLKDTLFQLLVVALVCACSAWQRAWQEPQSWWVRAGSGALLALLLAAVSGLRWYFACACLAVMPLLLIPTAWRSRAPRSHAFAAAGLILLLLGRAILAGGRAHVPPPVVALLTPSTSLEAMADLPSIASAQLLAAREDFVRTGGRTFIHEGESGARTPSPAPPAQPFAASEHASQIEEIRLLLGRVIDGWNRGDVPAILDTFESSGDVELWTDGQRTAVGFPEVRDSYRTFVAAGRGDVFALSGMHVDAWPDGTATAIGRWKKRRGSVETSGGVGFLLRRSAAGWRIVRLVSNRTDAEPTIADLRGRGVLAAGRPLGALPPGSTFAIRTASAPAAAPPQPTARTHATRLLAGAAAIVLPQRIGERLGLFHIGGGDGMVWLTELDSIALFATLIFAVAFIGARFARVRRDPLVWMIVALTLVTGTLLAYAVTNFGTLFRLREMVFLGVILAPVAAAVADARGSRGRPIP